MDPLTKSAVLRQVNDWVPKLNNYTWIDVYIVVGGAMLCCVIAFQSILPAIDYDINNGEAKASDSLK